MQGNKRQTCRQRKREKRQTLFLTCGLQIMLGWLWGEQSGRVMLEDEQVYDR